MAVLDVVSREAEDMPSRDDSLFRHESELNCICDRTRDPRFASNLGKFVDVPGGKGRVTDDMTGVETA